MKHSVTLWPEGKVIQIDSYQTLLEGLKENQIYIKSSCGGCASCGDCAVKVTAGVDNLSPPPFPELKLLGNVFHITKERLTCQVKISGPVTLDISMHDLTADEGKRNSKTTNFLKKTIKVRPKDEVKHGPRNDHDDKKKHDDGPRDGGMRRPKGYKPKL
jgi:ferredoxin